MLSPPGAVSSCKPSQIDQPGRQRTRRNKGNAHANSLSITQRNAFIRLVLKFLHGKLPRHPTSFMFLNGHVSPTLHYTTYTECLWILCGPISGVSNGPLIDLVSRITGQPSVLRKPQHGTQSRESARQPLHPKAMDPFTGPNSTTRTSRSGGVVGYHVGLTYNSISFEWCYHQRSPVQVRARSNQRSSLFASSRQTSLTPSDGLSQWTFLSFFPFPPFSSSASSFFLSFFFCTTRESPI